MKGMRILYAGWGFTPFRGGGSVRYAEALMRGMAGRGHAVGHFCTGRYGISRTPELRRWERGTIREFEIRNSPILPTWGIGTKSPRLEIGCAPVEDAFRAAVREFRPDLVHFHEFVTMPASLAGVAREEGVPYLCSLHDYATICATCLLFKYDRTVCLDYREGTDCVRCCAEAPGDSPSFRIALFAHSRWNGHPPAILAGAAAFAKTLLRRKARAESAVDACEGDSEGFILRRRAFFDALSGARAVLPVSRRVKELFALHGAEPSNFRVTYPSLPHLDGIRRRERTVRPGAPLRLGFLGMCLPTKGVETVFEAIARMEAPGSVEWKIHGGCESGYRDALVRKYPTVRATFAGPYKAEELNSVLDGIDVGIFPSLTEETFGFVAIEFLNAGIPVVASRIGAVPEYLNDGENGLLFPAGDATALAVHLEGLAASPARVAEMSRGCMPGERFEAHLERVLGIYIDVVG
jgi:glycosyltransferase involved in cell wall biosynthesis